MTKKTTLRVVFFVWIIFSYPSDMEEKNEFVLDWCKAMGYMQ